MILLGKRSLLDNLIVFLQVSLTFESRPHQRVSLSICIAVVVFSDYFWLLLLGGRVDVAVGDAVEGYTSFVAAVAVVEIVIGIWRW